jgi:hypothetical protein
MSEPPGYRRGGFFDRPRIGWIVDVLHPPSGVRDRRRAGPDTTAVHEAAAWQRRVDHGCAIVRDAQQVAYPAAVPERPGAVREDAPQITVRRHR